MKQSAAVGGDVLVVAIATAEKGAEFIVSSTEPLRGPDLLEPAHTSDPTESGGDKIPHGSGWVGSVAAAV
jgi:hypothetical protein